MIQDKQKVEKIYNYLSALATAHKSSNNKYNGWTLYDKNNKKLRFSVQQYNWDNIKYNFDLVDVDFKHIKYFGENKLERIRIRVDIQCDFSKLEIKECVVRENADLIGFFKKLDKVLENYNGYETLLTQILLSKVEGE